MNRTVPSETNRTPEPGTPFSDGFTLFEVLIATFIFAMIVSILFGSYTGSLTLMDQTRSQADLYGMARITLERIREDLESASLPDQGEGAEPDGDRVRNPGFTGEDLEIEGEDADSLCFLSTAHVVFDPKDRNTGLARIDYYVRESEQEGAGLVLYRIDTPVLEEAPEKGTGGMVMCEGLVSVNFTYYASGEALERWDSSEDEFKNRLPERVSVRMRFVDPIDPEHPLSFTTGVALPCAGGGNEKNP